MPGLTQTSERTRQSVDEEVKRIIDEAREEARRLLAENRNRLDALAQALLAKETLDEAEAYAAAEITRPAQSATVGDERAEALPGAVSAT